MKTTLVGSTGFVGGNLAAAHSFDAAYHSTDIAGSFGADNGLVVYCGMPAEKFTANADPAADRRRAEEALENIRRMAPERLVLVSTVDVYPAPHGVFENHPAGGDGAPAYGANRCALEEWVREEWPEALVLRLPGLFGAGLKKNFIYDMIALTPGMLREEKYRELAAREPLVARSYRRDDSGFWRLAAAAEDRAALRAFFAANDFNALSFTDSRAVFQFYNLARLWGDIQRCLKLELRTLNLATQPVEAGALYHALFGDEFVNHLSAPPPHYDMRTHYGRDFGGDDHYIADRTEVIGDIAKFVAAAMAGGAAE